jgi:two-component system, chemotaxis family, chemotaxis protein CheY
MPPGSRCRGVAIVDDDAELVRTYELIFRKRHVPVAFVAYDGKSALDKFRDANARPEVVIIDYRMPLMSGLELTGEIKKLEPCTRIVFISADDSVRQDALNAGANIFLKKPVGIKAIIESIGPPPGC